MGTTLSTTEQQTKFINLANTINDIITMVEDYQANKSITPDVLTVIQDVTGLLNNPLYNGALVQTEAASLMYSLSQIGTGSGTMQDIGSVLNNLGGLVNAVGTVIENPEVSLAGSLITAYGNTLTTVANWSSNTDLISNLTSIADMFDNGINNTINSAASSSALSNWVSFLLGNAQNQTDDENDPFGVDDPLVISTNGHAVTTTSLANGAFVDYRGTGFEEQSSWLSSNAGILVDITNANGTLNHGFTIIGSSTTNQNGNVQGQAGFTQLAALDTNHDGVINASDTDFNQIEILVGSNGQPGSGQLETLAQAGITSISLNSTAVNTTDANGDKTLATSAVTYSNGTTGTLSDMNMSVNTSNTIDESAGTINRAYANLPDVAGWGDVHNLQVAMAA